MKNLIYIVLGISLSCIAACEKDDPEIPNEEEVITTLTYTLTPQSGETDVVLTFKDLDGDGGNAPEISSGILAANTVYNGTLILLNEQDSPAVSITEEIEEEDVEHQFFFETTVNGTTISYDDTDGDGNPVGLSTILSTGDASSGTLSITLRHEPNKSASGVADGNIANAGGETDIEVTFNIDVQ